MKSDPDSLEAESARLVIFKCKLMQICFPLLMLVGSRAAAQDELSRTHPIWSRFYDISKTYQEPPYARFLAPQYLGITDDKGRLMMIVNRNNDISENWEWSGNLFMPIGQTKEACKYGVNYFMDALRH